MYEERGGLLNPRTASSLYKEPSCRYCGATDPYYYDRFNEVYYCDRRACVVRHEERFEDKEEL